MGLIGVFSYLGAAIQDYLSNYCIAAGRTIVGGKTLPLTSMLKDMIRGILINLILFQ